jgi:hypothetical protein
MNVNWSLRRCRESERAGGAQLVERAFVRAAHELKPELKLGWSSASQLDKAALCTV